MSGNDRDRNDGDVPRTVHDAMFQALFSDPALAAQELRAVLPPALVACVDWSVMTLMPTSFVDAVFHQRTSDLGVPGRFLRAAATSSGCSSTSAPRTGGCSSASSTPSA